MAAGVDFGLAWSGSAPAGGAEADGGAAAEDGEDGDLSAGGADVFPLKP